jgi:hypothetical protein
MLTNNYSQMIEALRALLYDFYGKDEYQKRWESGQITKVESILLGDNDSK